MRKTLFVLLMVTILFSFVECKKDASSSSGSETQQKENLYSKLGIQYSKTYEYTDLSQPQTPENGFLKEVVEYDKNGNPIRREIFQKMDSLSEPIYRLEMYKYDKNGNCIESINENKQGETEFSAKYKYENGLNTEYTVFLSNGDSDVHVTTKFNDKANPTELVSYKKGKDLDYKMLYNYDANDMLTETKAYDKDGNILESTKVIMKEDGTKEYQHFDKNNNLNRKKILTINDKNQVVEQRVIDLETNTTQISKNTFNDDGLLIEEERYLNDGEFRIIEKTEYIKFK